MSETPDARDRKRVARLTPALVKREVRAVTGIPPRKMRVEVGPDGSWAGVSVGDDATDEWSVYRDLEAARSQCVGDAVENLIHKDDGDVEVDYFTWEEVYRALSSVVDWDDLRPWVRVESRVRRVSEEECLADVPRSVLKLCTDAGLVDYERASLTLHQQGWVSDERLAQALVDTCGGPADFIRKIYHRALLRTPGGLIVELDGKYVLELVSKTTGTGRGRGGN